MDGYIPSHHVVYCGYCYGEYMPAPLDLLTKSRRSSKHWLIQNSTLIQQNGTQVVSWWRPLRFVSRKDVREGEEYSPFDNSTLFDFVVSYDKTLS
jgi:hypothetical protein